jgi:hypothetical protein
MSGRAGVAFSAIVPAAAGRRRRPAPTRGWPTNPSGVPACCAQAGRAGFCSARKESTPCLRLPASPRPLYPRSQGTDRCANPGVGIAQSGFDSARNPIMDVGPCLCICLSGGATSVVQCQSFVTLRQGREERRRRREQGETFDGFARSTRAGGSRRGSRDAGISRLRQGCDGQEATARQGGGMTRRYGDADELRWVGGARKPARGHGPGSGQSALPMAYEKGDRNMRFPDQYSHVEGKVRRRGRRARVDSGSRW